MRAWPVLFVMVATLGCAGQTGPASTDTSSDSLPSLEDRIEFLERYVTFRRGYTELGFHVAYLNNGKGMVPAPSEWDIRLVATVPPSELPDWIPADGVSQPTADMHWLVGVPGAGLADGITEWYSRAGLVVGIDRKRSVVAYHNWKY